MYVKWMDSFQPNRMEYYESLGENTQTSVPSIKRPSQLEQKPLPSHLRYAYLGSPQPYQLSYQHTTRKLNNRDGK